MCGIAGVVMRRGGAPDPAVLGRLEAAMEHRGPDSAGRFVDGPVALLSTRLAIIDVDHGQQPLYGPNRSVLVANGEIYNAPELRADLPGAVFHTHSDCEPPLHLYANEGIAFADRLRGMYAIALYDPARRRLVLSRDPFGIKPLYYVETEDYFAFASEAQALFAAGLADRGIVPEKRAELLQIRFTIGRETIFPGIRRVMPGETLAIEDGRIVERHARAPLPAAPRPEAGNLAERLDAVLSESVALHLRSDVPSGLFLSGGVDSSILLALIRRVTGRPVEALTVGYEAGDPADESPAAMRVAKAAGSNCQRVALTEKDFWALSPRAAAAVDDPTSDAAVLPNYMLAQAAAERGFKVMLCGEGADELFAGYVRHRRTQLPWRLWSRNPLSEGVFDGFASLPGTARWHDELAAVEARERTPGRTRLQQLQAVDCAERLPNFLLSRLDRCLMAHSVEGRTPFVDPVVAAFAFALPDRTKVGFKLGKLLLRDWLARALPEANPYARKRGFNPPVGRWIASREAELARLLPRHPGVAEVAPPELVRRLCAEAGKQSQAAWNLLFYALWHAHHVLGVPAEGDIGHVLSEAAARG